MEGDVRVPALEAREQHDCKWRARVLPSLWLTRDQMTFPIVASPIDNTSISESEVIHVTPLRDGVASPWVQVSMIKISCFPSPQDLLEHPQSIINRTGWPRKAFPRQITFASVWYR